MLTSLDETLRGLLRQELSQRGLNGVEIAFEAPSREWAAQLSKPTVNAFLYDVRESKEHRPADWETIDGTGGRADRRPPLRLDVSYALTAWTRAVEDEHRLLSQLLAVLHDRPTLAPEVLVGALREQPTDRYPVTGRVGRPRNENGPEFWTALDGSYKASIDYCVTLTQASQTLVERGPPVRTETVRVSGVDEGQDDEIHRLGGVVRDPAGAPVADAWVVLEGDAPRLAISDAQGRFVLDRVVAGPHRVQARSAAGAVSEGEVTVPAATLDIVLPERGRAAGRRRA